jgi:hypothetical protein
MSAETERLAELLDAWLDGDAVAAPSGELSELLAAAAHVRLLTDVAPPPSGLNRGRAAFVAAGVRQAEDATRVGFLPGLFTAFGRYRMAPLTMMVALLLLSGVVTTARAQSSLPGDLLYPVKRLTETVQVAITRGNDRVAVRAELQQRRLDETQLLLERHRAAPVAFEGRAELSADGLWRVGGVVVQFSGGLPEGLAAGAVVSVAGLTDPDGVVRVSSLRVLTPADVPVIQVVALATDQPEVMVAMVADEPTPTSRPASPTPLPVIATRIPLPTAEPPTVMPTGVPTSIAPEDPVREKQYVEWDGHLWRSNGDVWIVDGVEFIRARGGTRGDVVTCAFVHVRAEKKKDGKLYLDSLTVKGPPSEPTWRDVKGTIQDIGEDFMVIDKQRIVLPRDVKVADLVVGTFVKVHLRVECGRNFAEKIEVDGPKPIPITGIVRYVDETTLVVDDITLRRSESMEIDGNLMVGALVNVTAVKAEDGALVAIKVKVVRNAPPTETPTVPTATATTELPSPTPSDTPAAPATAGPTVAPGEP